MTVRCTERLYEVESPDGKKITTMRKRKIIDLNNLKDELSVEVNELAEIMTTWEIVGQRMVVSPIYPVKTKEEIEKLKPKVPEKLEWPKEFEQPKPEVPEEIPLKVRKNEEIEVVFKDFMRKHPDTEYQTPTLCNLLDVPYEKLTRIVGRLKKQGFIYVVNPLTGTAQRRFKLSDSQREHQEENKDLKALKEGETLEMGVGNNE